MARNIKFMTGNFYHVYNRGVRKSDIFLKNQDYKRWEKLLYWCNNYDYSYSRYLSRLFQIKRKGGSVEQLNELVRMHKLDTPLVDIHAFVEMSNHFHLLLRQISDDGIAKFMQKLATAYAMYFNLTVGFKGAVFEGSYCAVEVLSDAQLMQLFRYIHLNPQAAGLVDIENLLSYQWSSLSSYCSGSDDKALTKDFFLGLFKSKDDLLEFIVSAAVEGNHELLKDVVIDDHS
ncbi:hypothetical protein COW99_04440 [Candidatus Roizmanbacteria bacterium CG22_combo_CG10-13_8_21_14_all_38_20]|uniref:Transposase IS200-like domain-containing protein n=1 Tax=Candidatus Roizmanbacteria bacterium CG22_combo_CG10-13_8_21_14_all_38_20 TaxID=1974862 RepID=A0A2H0BUK7_9BACT|nr:MAG: hypothetical protein COW99_04440 [Candidatus Roizmanbacteria bacterium CG22_combo_CG10-13_8_21_14_all_38_20]PJC31473.1 MAG: hypothetical protein CO050_02700 [Candidatus Roizmanbacteria bacterium CG_4_9_14_0_2_um_filter_38_17]